MKKDRHYDVIVVGGGAAGLAAAIGAKQAGASVLLLERYGSLGGQATHANVLSYCGFFTREAEPKQLVFGAGDMLLKKLASMGLYNGPRISPAGNAIAILDHEATKLAFDLLAEDCGIECLLHCCVTGARTDGAGKILSVICSDDAGGYEISADAFVDASGDANLGFLAGAPLRFGDGKGGSYMSTRAVRFGGVRPGSRFSPAMVKEAVLKGKSEGLSHITKETGMVLTLMNGEALAILPSAAVPSLDAETLTAVERDTRKQEYDYLEAFRRHLPGMEDAYIISGGDVMGLRDTRHLECEYTLTGDDVLGAVKQEDGIACGAWPCEMHKGLNEMAEYMYLPDGEHYDIPLRSLKVKGMKNLWAAGRTIGADPVAFASVRVMGIGFATGQAAGVAAALSKGGEPDAGFVRAELERQGAKLR